MMLLRHLNYQIPTIFYILQNSKNSIKKLKKKKKKIIKIRYSV